MCILEGRMSGTDMDSETQMFQLAFVRLEHFGLADCPHTRISPLDVDFRNSKL